MKYVYSKSKLDRFHFFKSIKMKMCFHISLALFTCACTKDKVELPCSKIITPEVVYGKYAGVKYFGVGNNLDFISLDTIIVDSTFGKFFYPVGEFNVALCDVDSQKVRCIWLYSGMTSTLYNTTYKCMDDSLIIEEKYTINNPFQVSTTLFKGAKI